MGGYVEIHKGALWKADFSDGRTSRGIIFPPRPRTLRLFNGKKIGFQLRYGGTFINRVCRALEYDGGMYTKHPEDQDMEDENICYSSLENLKKQQQAKEDGELDIPSGWWGIFKATVVGFSKFLCMTMMDVVPGCASAVTCFKECYNRRRQR